MHMHTNRVGYMYLLYPDPSRYGIDRLGVIHRGLTTARSGKRFCTHEMTWVSVSIITCTRALCCQAKPCHRHRRRLADLGRFTIHACPLRAS